MWSVPASVFKSSQHSVGERVSAHVLGMRRVARHAQNVEIRLGTESHLCVPSRYVTRLLRVPLVDSTEGTTSNLLSSLRAYFR